MPLLRDIHRGSAGAWWTQDLDGDERDERAHSSEKPVLDTPPGCDGSAERSWCARRQAPSAHRARRKGVQQPDRRAVGVGEIADPDFGRHDVRGVLRMIETEEVADLV